MVKREYMLKYPVCTDSAEIFACLLERFAVAGRAGDAVVVSGIAKICLDDVLALGHSRDLKLARIRLSRRIDCKNEDLPFVICRNCAVFKITRRALGDADAEALAHNGVKHLDGDAVGGHSVASVITKQKLSIGYLQLRIVEGTPWEGIKLGTRLTAERNQISNDSCCVIK